ncbi:DUF4907 domain-containing protein [Dyadobacter chenwenxiniae]|uniref:DUF4907 domain-containing protein n=1 Tax=Dyadobacter chenwenxiniae TaxID=2906456 RepID=A0A9X1PN21_9BACT|nr:DUF4907 domain-containing protein [Dyadobacter chenwenxiniae]MCF0052524.1 DUF4907 domain-containing protein [Dyadobacter chenwenxiniae]MCF0063841.1 DUF4907 domain-containing protein [Dyadobacter chenwenxiniae]UON83517.1 DUF4907 domain-containing protein [Dyadobacter chenwenxiniae]
MSSKKKLIVIVGILAFAAVTYIILPKGDIGADGKGLRRLKVEAFKVDSGWAYRILDKDTPIIEQRSIPGIAGNSGFKDEQSALRTGKLVESKLEKGIFPPSVSASELDSLGIDF